MTRKTVASALAGVALIASLTAYVGASSNAGMSSGTDFGLIRQPAAKRLPEGLVLPASDIDLNVASLITVDLDADGDLDVIAADTSSGTLGIVVGKRRRRPSHAKTPGATEKSRQRACLTVRRSGTSHGHRIDSVQRACHRDHRRQCLAHAAVASARFARVIRRALGRSRYPPFPFSSPPLVASAFS
jgi:hypothetical protein